jgi:XTP/dITP diphosphohydrolase
MRPVPNIVPSAVRILEMSEPRLIIATNNPGKVSEFRELLQGCGWQIIAPSDVGVSIDVEESGASYEENARLKAQAFCRASGLPALADDSGLEVDALGGEPGALHHVHGWDGRDNEERIAILLRALEDVPMERRTGRFRSVIVVAFPDGPLLKEEGSIEGLVAEAPSGANGWGYDPVFLLPGRGVTVAELTPSEKNRISHRAVAAAKIRERLRELAS